VYLEKMLFLARKLFMDPMEKLTYTPEELDKEIVEIAKKQIENEGAQLFVLGCAIFDLFLKPKARARLGSSLGVVVVEAQEVAVKTAEMLVDLKLMHGKVE
jgi:Asp/Glu/hydantoin racemase